MISKHDLNENKVIFIKHNFNKKNIWETKQKKLLHYLK